MTLSTRIATEILVSTLSTRIATETCYRHKKWAPNLHGRAAPPKSKFDNTPSQEFSIPAVNLDPLLYYNCKSSIGDKN